MGSEIRKENVDAQRGSHILKLKSSTGHRHDAFAISKKKKPYCCTWTIKWRTVVQVTLLTDTLR